MKKFTLLIELEAEDCINSEDITINESDMIDGFEISRNLKSNDDDIAFNFFLTSAKIVLCADCISECVK